MTKTIAKMAVRAVGRTTSRPKQSSRVRVKGVVNTKCFRDGKLLWEDTSENIVFNAGLNYLCGVALGAVSQEATWWCGLLDATPTFSATNTFTDLSELTEYTAATRPVWTDASTGIGQRDNSGSVAAYTISAAVTCGGVFLVATNTKGANGKLVYSGVAFTGGNRILANADKLEVTYTQSVADDGA
jgi:hypothetical protein